VLSALILEKVQSLAPNSPAAQAPRLGAYVMVVGGMLRLWNVNREAFDKVLEEVRQRGGAALGQPYVRPTPAQFIDVMSEALVFPLNVSDEAVAKERV